MQKLLKAAQVMELTVNMQKTQYMKVTKKQHIKMLRIVDQKCERVKEF